jgi:hypothetical protein
MPAAANRASKVGSLPFAVLLRSVGDLVLQVAGLMIAAELAERRLVELKQNFAELFGLAGCETLSVNSNVRKREGRKIKSFIKGESVQRIASSSNPKIVSTSPPRHRLLVQTACQGL